MERRGLKLSNGFLDPRPKKCVPYKAGPWSGPNRTSIFQEYGPKKLGPSFFCRPSKSRPNYSLKLGPTLLLWSRKIWPSLILPFTNVLLLLLLFEVEYNCFLFFIFFREYLRKKKETHVKSPNKKEKQRGVWEMHWSDPLK